MIPRLGYVLLTLAASISLATAQGLTRIENPEEPKYIDEDKSLDKLLESTQNSFLYTQSLSPDQTLLFGADVYTRSEMIDSLKMIIDFLKDRPDAQAFNSFLHAHFLAYRAPNDVLFSSYYVHSLKASLAKTDQFHYPIYARPKDLVERGGSIGRISDGRLIPYFTRRAIDSEHALANQGLEIAWADNPLDVLFLQIQGSGFIETPQGKRYHIRYAGNNGKPYSSVGKTIIQSGAIAQQQFSRSLMIQYLNSLEEKKRQEILNTNERYIFFELMPASTPVRGSLKVPLTPERSIASDPKIYPPGALAFIQTQQPKLDASNIPVSTQPLNRFVFNQDEGGAIKGESRIDYFAGEGKRAETFAQNMWYKGTLYFFIKKK